MDAPVTHLGKGLNVVTPCHAVFVRLPACVHARAQMGHRAASQARKARVAAVLHRMCVTAPTSDG